MGCIECSGELGHKKGLAGKAGLAPPPSIPTRVADTSCSPTKHQLHLNAKKANHISGPLSALGHWLATFLISFSAGQFERPS